MILNSLVFGMDPQQAVEAPRFATSSNVNSFYPHVYYPGQLDLEDGFPESTEGVLKALGHKIHPHRQLRARRDGVGARP